MKNFFIYSLKFIIIKLSSKKFNLQSKNFYLKNIILITQYLLKYSPN